MDIEAFRHKISISPRFADIDMLGHVNNAKYHTYIEEARVLYADEVFRGYHEAVGSGMILAKTSIDYLLPLHHRQIIEVYTRCSRIGRKSFDLTVLMVMAVDHKIVSSAITTLVAYDYNKKQSILLPSAWRERIIDYERAKPELT